MTGSWPFRLIRSRSLLRCVLMWGAVVPGRAILVLRQRRRGGRRCALTLVVMGVLL